VKKRELNVHKHEVSIAADSPTRFESKFLTVRLHQQHSDDLKPFSPFVQVRFRTAMNRKDAHVWKKGKSADAL
jgi:hypothetical protein